MRLMPCPESEIFAAYPIDQQMYNARNEIPQFVEPLDYRTHQLITDGNYLS
jgi:hypothetical protein